MMRTICLKCLTAKNFAISTKNVLAAVADCLVDVGQRYNPPVIHNVQQNLYGAIHS